MRWGVPARRALIILVAVPILVAIGMMALIVLTPLPEPDNPQTTEILDITGETVTSLYTENRKEIPVTEMPSHLLHAIVAVEDDRFYHHHGFDFRGIGRALVRNIMAGEIIEGGSTLTQQLAKNLYLSHDRTVARKLKEAWLTIKLERKYSKTELLGLYWNTIYLGEGMYGVELAATRYFDKSAKHLTLGEAALLAGLPRSPEYYAPTKNLSVSLSRRNLVLDKMLEQGFISAAAANEARAEPPPKPKTPSITARAPYFVDYVRQELTDRFPGIASDLSRGGYRIHTTLDQKMQQAAEKAIASAFPGAHASDLRPQVSLVALDPLSGHIRALVGGRDPTVERNRVLEARQPGSAFKPFVYAAALETYKYTPISTQPDAPAEFPGTIPGSPWRPRNYTGSYSNAPATMREALKRSLNVVTARWMETLKPDPVIKLAARLGIQSPLPHNLTIGLGSAEVSPLELTAAYAPFANEGLSIVPTAVLKVVDRDGRVVAEQRAAGTRVLDPGIAFIITDMLREVLRPGGTASSAAHYLGGRPAAGKTGTSDEARDAWFVGYTPDLVASVWVGNDDRSPGGNRTGGTVAAPIWARFMRGALAGMPIRGWRPPANVNLQEICSITGLRPNTSCPIVREYFLQGTAPNTVDPTVHWEDLLPELPGVPWAPPGLLPPSQPPEPVPPQPAPPAPPGPVPGPPGAAPRPLPPASF